jgi:hypothetical protein|tara:strand:+ start:501 stop:686 length:186 start_codon:yes stop_codon:yes gene_type:complete
MKKSILNSSIKIVVLSTIVTSAYNQSIEDHQSKNNMNFRSIVENASRSQQVVWVEDFTGLN